MLHVVAEVQALQFTEQAVHDITPAAVAESKKPAGQVPTQIFGSAVVPAPFKNNCVGGWATPLIGRGLQEVQTVALVQIEQAGLLSVHNPHDPSVLR